MSKVGVFCTLFDKSGRVVCVRQNYAPFFWTTPGGKLEPHESPTDAVVREVLEETGYHIEALELVGVYAAPFKDDIVLGFSAAIAGRERWNPNDEIAAVDLAWPSSLPTPMKANSAQRIKDACGGRVGVYRVYETMLEHGEVMSQVQRLHPQLFSYANRALRSVRRIVRRGLSAPQMRL